MKCVELNKAGNFDTWEPSKIRELKEKRFASDLGKKLLYENELIRVWEITLFPKERLPFRKQNRDFYWVSLTDAKIICRYSDGKIAMLYINRGDYELRKVEDQNPIWDMENIGEYLLVLNLMELKIPIRIAS